MAIKFTLSEEGRTANATTGLNTLAIAGTGVATPTLNFFAANDDLLLSVLLDVSNPINGVVDGVGALRRTGNAAFTGHTQVPIAAGTVTKCDIKNRDSVVIGTGTVGAIGSTNMFEFTAVIWNTSDPVPFSTEPVYTQLA